MENVSASFRLLLLNLPWTVDRFVHYRAAVIEHARWSRDSHVQLLRSIDFNSCSAFRVDLRVGRAQFMHVKLAGAVGVDSQDLCFPGRANAWRPVRIYLELVVLHSGHDRSSSGRGNSGQVRYGNPQTNRL